MAQIGQQRSVSGRDQQGRACTKWRDAVAAVVHCVRHARDAPVCERALRKLLLHAIGIHRVAATASAISPATSSATSSTVTSSSRASRLLLLLLLLRPRLRRARPVVHHLVHHRLRPQPSRVHHAARVLDGSVRTGPRSRKGTGSIWVCTRWKGSQGGQHESGICRVRHATEGCNREGVVRESLSERVARESACAGPWCSRRVHAKPGEDGLNRRVEEARGA